MIHTGTVPDFRPLTAALMPVTVPGEGLFAPHPPPSRSSRPALWKCTRPGPRVRAELILTRGSRQAILQAASPRTQEPRHVRKTFKHMLATYGMVAVVVYFTIFFAVLFGAWLAIERGADLPALAARMGLPINRAVAGVGSFTLAYLFTKITQPVRIAATLALTPLLARVYERVTGRAPSGISTDAPAPAADPADATTGADAR